MADIMKQTIDNLVKEREIYEAALTKIRYTVQNKTIDPEVKVNLVTKQIDKAVRQVLAIGETSD